MKLNKKIIAALGACIMLTPCATALTSTSTQTVQAAKRPNRYKKLPHYVVYVKKLGKGDNAIQAGTVLDTTGYNFDYFYGKPRDWYMYSDELVQDIKFIRIPKNATKGFKSYKKAVSYSKKHFPRYWYRLKHPEKYNKSLWTLNGTSNLISPDDFKNSKPFYTDDTSGSVEEDW